MKLKPDRLVAYHREAALAKLALAQGDLTTAFHHLERAHILGQPSVGAHSWTHWMMLRIGWRQKDAREVRGQILRLAAGGFLSAVGVFPLGNTGGANVPAKKSMPLPADLERLCS